MSFFGPSALDLIRAQRQGFEDYCKLRSARPGDIVSQKRWTGKLHVAWKCGWSQASLLDSLRTGEPAPAKPTQRQDEVAGISQHTRDFIEMARALGNIK